MMDALYRFRWWLASRITGVDLHDEVDAAYEAGREYGAAQRFLERNRE
jgi:hypothetical protein